MECFDYCSFDCDIEKDLRQFECYRQKMYQWGTSLYTAYRYSEVPLLVCGVFGHCLSLMTAVYSRNMRTPSFIYFKVLTVVELIYCLNALLQRIIDNHLTKTFSHAPQRHFVSYFAAFYSAIFSRSISSVTGYVIQYLTLLTAVDRCLAVYLAVGFGRLNSKRTVWIFILAATVVSVVINSWSTWLDKIVVGKFVQITNDTGARLYVIRSRTEPTLYLDMAKIKNTYNCVIRIGCSILLVIVTAIAIHGFVSYSKRRNQILKEEKWQVKRERNLFSMLIIIVVLAFIQVVPAETKRILDLNYPNNFVERSLDNPKLSFSDRIFFLQLHFYGHICVQMIANWCTFLNRSLSFYVYFAFNNTFRKELAKVLSQKFCRNRVTDERTGLLTER